MLSSKGGQAIRLFPSTTVACSLKQVIFFMSQSIRLTATIVAVLSIATLAGWLLWKNSDPQLAEVELTTNIVVVGESVAAAGTEIVDVTANTEFVETTPSAEVVVNNVNVTETAVVPGDTVTGVAATTTIELTTTESATTDTSTATETVAPAEPVETIETSVLVSAIGPGVKELCEVAVTETTTVHKVMLSASDQCGFSYAGKKQGNLGFFVEEIAGLQQSVKDGFYWVFSVNGEKSQLGVSTRTVESNDTIQWTYEAEY